MAAKIIWSPHAVRDLEEIHDYISFTSRGIEGSTARIGAGGLSTDVAGANSDLRATRFPDFQY